ncbi:MAG TPA: hypothetical protein VG186_13480 [Solirubrobacteraceae bacterium]|jgi:hypothetical protein|nr:hypothetical protein [Solirubrobacteraceae bacterium]
MSATPPEAKPEYSRAPPQSPGPATISAGLLAGGVIGGLLLIVAEFTPLYDQESVTSRIALHTIHTGSHHSYALVPIGLVAIVVAVGAARSRSRSRAALLALGALGVAAALVAVLGDLPDANSSGFVTGFVKVNDVPQLGLYLETLGAALLIVTGGAGFVLAVPGRVRAPA